jgi:hypothetical protein
MRCLSIAALTIVLGACTQGGPSTSWTPIPRPAPDDPAPLGIAYLCDGRKEVAVVYAKNRASVTYGDKTWRAEYQPSGAGFRYVDASVEWSGRDDLAVLRQAGSQRPIAFNCRPTRRLT